MTAVRTAAIALAFAATIVVGTSGRAQQPAFDMGTERQELGIQADTPTLDGLGLRNQILGSDTTAIETPPSALAAAPSSATHVRPIVPFADLTLSGEADTRSWAVYLSAAEVNSPAVLHLSFINALLVAPELSTIRVFVNDYPVIAQAIGSADSPSHFVADIPAGLLHAGANRIRFDVTQRHRTDCTVASTYELWTTVEQDGTFLEFTGPGAGQIADLSALSAIGVDATGKTTIEIIAPSLGQPAASTVILRLAQYLSLQLRTPEMVVHVSQANPEMSGPGVLTVVLGTSEDVESLLGHPAARTGVSFLADSASPVLVISGASWADVAASVEALAAPLQRTLAEQGPSSLQTAAWHLPEVPVIDGSTSISLNALGVPTTEFTGRLFRVSFQVAMPSDLYAQAYGYANLYLDAAYAPNLLPGSEVDVYVNGEIAATTPLTNGGGGILRHLKIEVPLRNFRSGVNTVSIEAIVSNQADLVCLPGSTGSTSRRFVLFDTSEFTVPDFGHAVQLPDLSALAGTGFPLATPGVALTVALGDATPETLSAAATFVGKITALAGTAFPISTSTNSRTPFGLYVGAASQLPAGIATQVGISSASLTAWQNQGLLVDPVADTTTGSDTQDVFNRWRDALSGGGGWQGQVSSFQEWLNRTFDFTFSSFRFGAARTLKYTPPDDAGLILAQSPPAGDETSWTVLMAPTAEALQANTELLLTPDRWHGVSGQLVAYRPQTGVVTVVPLPGADVIVTGPNSVINERLVATNWLSKNVVVYGGLLLALCTLLAVSTHWLLGSLGRHE